jgi:hypothetical protein
MAKRFFSSWKLGNGDRKGIQGERDGLSLSFPFTTCFSHNKYIFRMVYVCSTLVNDGKEIQKRIKMVFVLKELKTVGSVGRTLLICNKDRTLNSLFFFFAQLEVF